MTDEDERPNPNPPIQASRNNGWFRFVGYVKRKRYERAAKKKNETPTDKAARRTATATVWMAIFTLVLAATSGLTIWILKNQLREMHEGGIDTHALAIAADKTEKSAEKSAQAARDFADTAHDINGGILGAVGQLKAVADNARKSIQAAQDAFRDDQRAWVGVSKASLIQFEAGKPIKIDVLVLNTGKTPARKAHMATGFSLWDSPLSGPPPEAVQKMERLLPGNIAGTLPPQGEFILRLGDKAGVGSSIATPDQRIGVDALIKAYDRIKSGRRL